MWFVIAYCNKIFIFAVLERWLIHFNETECSFVYLIKSIGLCLSVCLSVHPSVGHTREPRLICSQYRHTSACAIYDRRIFLVSRGRISQSFYRVRPKPVRKRCKIRCKLLLFTHRKSNAKMVTSNEGVMTVNLFRVISPNSALVPTKSNSTCMTLCEAILSIAELL